MWFMDLISHVDHVLDQLRQDSTLRCRIKKIGRVDVDLEKDGAQIMVEHKIKAKDFKAAEFAIKLVFGLQEDEAHDFIDLVTHLSLECIHGCQTLLNQVVSKSSHCHSHFFLSFFELWMLLLN